ncbi:hypothetical protein PROFUN_14471 [Planoprotostelium fungivorum]|uniref:Trafficking protein particle complex subunit n=1 Tax=Planoprotostelium fungivorum TaxID=1890364 RepID=A0A2P6MZW4_9EUKA|nr:hypothetical protein PROFUN_14471 [Planoprotostelium fungivorum]
MTIFNLFIYSRQGNCIYYEEWNRKNVSSNLDEEQKLMYGFLWQIKNFVQKSSPNPELEKTGFHFFRTNSYKLHFFETATNIKFVITSDPDAPDLRDLLKTIYKNTFVEYVIKNPLYTMGEPVRCELFVEKLQLEVRAHTSYKQK